MVETFGGNGGHTTMTPDWKLNANVQCRITLEKLIMPTPNLRFCSRKTVDNIEKIRKRSSTSTFQTNGSGSASVFTPDVYLKSQLAMNILMNILRKCEEKCELCAEYVQQLRNHIIQTHGSGENHCDTDTHSETESEYIPVRNSESEDISTTSFNNNTSSVSINSSASSIGELGNDDFLNSYSSDNSRDENSLNNESSIHVILNNENNDQYQDINNEVLKLKSEPSLEHTNNFYTIDIESNVKQEPVDDDTEYEEDPLLNLTENNFNNHQSNLVTELPGQLTIIKSEIYEGGPVAGASATSTTSRTRTQLTNKSKTYKCKLCGRLYHSSYGLTRHNKIHTGENLHKSHKCDICEESFVTKYRLIQHKLMHKGEKHSYKCETCGNNFLYYWILLKHKKTHNQDNSNSNKCDFCPKRFPTTSSLLIHTTEHTGEKIHRCEICGKCYPHGYTLRRHKIEVHSAKKPCYECDMCEKSYIAFDKLSKHILAEHTGEGYRYTCEIETCGKGFHYLSHFLSHKKTHSSPRSYKCGVCGKSLKSLGTFNQHMLIHSKND